MLAWIYWLADYAEYSLPVLSVTYILLAVGHWSIYRRTR